MEALWRVERWVLAGLGFCLLATLTYAVLNRGIEPPVALLGNPDRLERLGGRVRAVYILDRPYTEAANDLDLKLQIKGFKRQASYYYYARGQTEHLTVYIGEAVIYANGSIGYRWDPNKTSVVYTVRTPGWGQVWAKLKRDWRRPRPSQWKGRFAPGSLGVSRISTRP